MEYRTDAAIFYGFRVERHNRRDALCKRSRCYEVLRHFRIEYIHRTDEAIDLRDILFSHHFRRRCLALN